MAADFETIVNRASSQDADEREQAARQLQSFLPEDRAIVFLANLLGDTDWRVRRASVESFSGCEFSHIQSHIFDALYDEENAGKRNAAIEVLSNAGSRIVPYAGAHLSSENNDVRMFLINVLAELRDDTYLDQIVEATRQDDPNLISSALLALGRIANPATKPVLLEFLQTSDPWIKFQAIEAAGQMQDVEFLEVLIANVNDLLFRRVALKALGTYHHADAYRILMQQILFLGDGFREALDSLFQLYRSVQPSVIAEVERSQIRAEWRSMVNSTRLKDLEEKAATLDEEEREKITEMLNWLRDEIQTGKAAADEPQNAPEIAPPDEMESPLLLRAIKAESAENRAQAAQQMGRSPRPEFVHPLISALADEEPRVRELAARSLGAYADPECREPLMGCTKDDSVRVRIASYESLAGISNSEFAQTLAERLPQEIAPAQAALLKSCTRLNPALGFDLALKYSKSIDPEVRSSACEVLARSENASHQKRLLALLQSDPAWRVRLAALQAICDQNKPDLSAFLINRFGIEKEPLLRQQILRALKQCEMGALPEFIFSALVDKDLADDAYQLLLYHKQRHREQLSSAAAKQHPDIRRIITTLLMG